jgi:pyrroline-5-carboxylate reductase
MEENIKTGFIGAGNMARSLVGGLIASGMKADRIQAFDPDEQRVQQLVKDFGIHAAANNQAMLDGCDVVVLAVKPQVMGEVVSALKLGSHRPLILSIAAGITTRALRQWFGEELALVRAMPNTPALVRSGATGLYATEQVSAAQRDQAESILRAVGLTLWVAQESELDTVTALSGSGPAYFFYVMEAMEKAAEKLGLPADVARLLTVQTAFGAAKLALEIEEDPRVLRERVTSPGGTTERAVTALQDGKLVEVFEQALKAAHDRSVELATQLENH